MLRGERLTEVCAVEVGEEVEETDDGHDAAVELADKSTLGGGDVFLMCLAEGIELCGC